MTRTITFYRLEKSEVQWPEHGDYIQYYTRPLNGEGSHLVQRNIPIRHCGHITPAGGKVDEYYALHPQLQELFERELRRMEYLDVEIVNNIRAEDSRVIGALSEKVRDLDESLKLVCKANETLDQRNREWCRSYDGFATAPLWRRLYVAIFSPRSIFPS